MDLFPFSKIRPGQKEFLEDCRKVINIGGHLVAHVPTGIGKTAAVLTPSLEVSLKKGKTIFFLTPKHTQHTIVIDTLKRIKRKFGGSFIVVDFIGKQWMCPYPRVRDLSSRDFNEFCRAQKREERCEFYKGVHLKKFSKNVKRVIEEVNERILHSEEIKELCRKNMFCPYEICIKAGKQANVIICDYFHIFSPKVRKAFLLRLEKELEESILIIDEAHNLPDRVRKILSYSLSEFTLKRAMKEANFLGYNEVSEFFRDIEGVLKELGKGIIKREKEIYEIYVRREEFTERVREETELSYGELTEVIDELGEEVLKIPKRYRSYSKTISRFLKNWNKDDPRYARILTRRNKFLTLSYRCLDPGVSTKEVFSKSFSTIFMSGTLIPLEMYEKILDLDEERILLKEYESPFPKKNRLILLVPGVTTQFKKRSELMYKNYAEKISKIVEEIPKNVALFSPSYEVMNSILKHLKTDKEVLIETKDMKKEQRMILYNRLVNLMGEGDGQGSILAGVQAGSFSEGVDYPENLLDGVIIVGLPLETPNLEVKALIEYYDFKFERGWDFGYIYPAMNRALQAAGRCIRSETDRGVIVLMDERFKWRNYSKCFPKDFLPIITEIPEKYVKRFFLKKRS
jgi:DNA excision repair protein ERCC-2